MPWESIQNKLVKISAEADIPFKYSNSSLTMTGSECFKEFYEHAGVKAKLMECPVKPRRPRREKS